MVAFLGFCICYILFTSALSSSNPYWDDNMVDLLDLDQELAPVLAPAPAPAPAASDWEAPITGAFDITNYGAVGDGETSCSSALLEAWEDACSHAANSTLYIPNGSYLVGPLLLSGPCHGNQSPRVVIHGTLKAPKSLDDFPKTDWIVFKNLRGVNISGGARQSGMLDARGKDAWTHSSCHKGEKCGTFPISLKLSSVSYGSISNIGVVNSKGFHMGIHKSNNIEVHGVKIRAPQESPNTDGIHISHSTNISISSSHIGVGDDCISIGPGTSNISVSSLHCGPGHGISVGSLGKYKSEENVVGVTVTNCTINGTQNGLRVKTWPGAAASIASNMKFENVVMINVSNPILIDQEYCPSHRCNSSEPSLVHIIDIHFKNVTGTYNSKSAVTLLCSSSVPCQNVLLDHINLTTYVEEESENSRTGRFVVKGLLQGLQVLSSRF